MHEVMRRVTSPASSLAAADLVKQLSRLDAELAPRSHPVCGASSVFIGQIHSGEIFNQFPQVALARRNSAGCRATTTRRGSRVSRHARPARGRYPKTHILCEWMMIRDAFALDPAVALGGSLSGMLRVDLRIAVCRRAPSRLSTTATASGHWRAFPRSLTAREQAGSTPCQSGSRSTTWSASLSYTRRRPGFTAIREYTAI